LREFLGEFFEEYDVEEMLIAETEAEATTDGWAPEFGELPGENYAKNPEGEQSRRYARVLVNGTFNEHLDGLDTPLDNEDRVTFIYVLLLSGHPPATGGKTLIVSSSSSPVSVPSM
jgi:molybdopterin converting factor small subunit